MNRFADKVAGVCSLGVAAVWLISVSWYVLTPCNINTPWNNIMSHTCQSFESWNHFAWYGQISGALPGVLLLLLPQPWLIPVRHHWLHSVGIITLVSPLVILGIDPASDRLTDSLEYIGVVTGRAAAVYLGMLLLVVSRSSLLSVRYSLGYASTIASHRAAGWWLVAMSWIHSFAFVAEYFLEGDLNYVLQSCFPLNLECGTQAQHCLNTLGLVNGFGVVAFLAITILGFFSREHVRRTSYEHFYFTHLATSFAFLVTAALHDFPIILFAFPGLALYANDRLAARRSRKNKLEMTAEVMCRNDASSVVLLSWNTGRSISHLLPGSRWVYLRSPSLSMLEWHPYSLMQQNGQVHVLVKGAGDWSRSLCELAGLPLELSVEGPYGKPLRASPTTRELLLIAGGVGIAPFIDLLANLDGLGRTWKKITLIWAVRGHEFGGLSRALNVQSFSRAADVLIFITSPEETEMSMHGVSIIWGGSQRLASNRVGSPSEFFISSLLISVAVSSSRMLHDVTINIFHDSVNSLVRYTLMLRACPLLSTAIIVVISGLGLLLVNKTCRSPPDNNAEGLEDETFEHSARLALPMQHQCQVQCAKPDLLQVIQQTAELGPVEVQACGPERMLHSVAESVCLLRKRGLDVLMDNLESAL